jgi:hypothetical protein
LSRPVRRRGLCRQDGRPDGRSQLPLSHVALHPHNIGRPNAAKYLDQALRYILGHDGVWNTTADDIADYYIAHHYDQVSPWIATQKAQGQTRPF